MTVAVGPRFAVPSDAGTPHRFRYGGRRSKIAAGILVGLVRAIGPVDLPIEVRRPVRKIKELGVGLAVLREALDERGDGIPLSWRPVEPEIGQAELLVVDDVRLRDGVRHRRRDEAE